MAHGMTILEPFHHVSLGRKLSASLDPLARMSKSESNVIYAFHLCIQIAFQMRQRYKETHDASIGACCDQLHLEHDRLRVDLRKRIAQTVSRLSSLSEPLDTKEYRLPRNPPTDKLFSTIQESLNAMPSQVSNVFAASGLVTPERKKLSLVELE
ncbi:unnamed protein product [Protopolystoma xenopodis]|uniref:Uncharacterized protein n=1 Tax=Protopolystoma xenopodis TaxID=117903 RepID=A0A3S5B189_9PLAT|nr:unnamed protein product [Protopolystoma xenopodis]